ncbi:MAG TPA: response regulator [Geobacterales bacterium]|nr:response regulator [Geobacterales bacterium]
MLLSDTRLRRDKVVISMKKALIGDDEPIIRMSLKKRLQELGYQEVVECGDGERAVQLALSLYPDVIFLDVAMPKKDGITAAQEIRGRLKVPILLLTASLDPETIRRAREAGVAAYLTKPLRDQDLLPALELAFGHSDEVEALKEKVEDLQDAIETRKTIEKAKGLLMQKQGLKEAEAFRKMQKLAMDKRKSMRQIAEAILLTEM